MRDPYKILGIREDATDSEIKKAYLEKVKVYHPDLNKDKPTEELNEIIADISTAYESIKDETARNRYKLENMSVDNILGKYGNINPKKMRRNNPDIYGKMWTVKDLEKEIKNEKESST